MNAPTAKAEQLRILNEALPLPDPQPLDSPVAPPVFPMDALPRYIEEIALATAHQYQAPTDMPAVVCLGALSAAAGGRVEIEARPGWREPANLYLMLFSDPASRKTPVVKALSAPLRSAEKRLRAVARPKHLEAKSRWEIADKVAKGAIDAAAKAAPGDRDEMAEHAVQARLKADEIVIPPLPQILSEDSTPEALVGVMAHNGGRAAVIAAETDALDTLVGSRYSKNKGSNLGIILKGHSGEPHRADRKSRGSDDLERMNITLMLMGQPAVLTQIVDNTEWAGRGFLARLLISVPDETVGYRTPGTPPVPERIAADYLDRIEQLTLDLAGLQVTNSAFGSMETLLPERDEPHLLRLCAEADDFLLGIETEIEPQLREEGRLGGITAWAGKLAGHTLRIAALLHVAEFPLDATVALDTLERAWRIACYFTEHALIAFRQVGLTGDRNAQIVLDYLIREKPKEFTIRDLHGALKGGRRFKESVTVLAAVEVLEEKGWVFRKYAPEKTGPGRKPSPAFELHPNILQPKGQAA